VTLEPLLLAVVATSGAGVLLWVGRAGWLDLVALAIPTGTALVATVSLLLVAAPVPYGPGAALLVTVLVGAGAAISRLRAPQARDQDRSRPWQLLVPVGGWAALTAVGVLAFRRMRWTRVTADSYEYLEIAGAMAALGGPSPDPHLMVARQLLVGGIHNLAALGGESFLVALAPLYAVSAVSLSLWVVRALRPRGLEPLELALLAALAVALLTTNRVLFHAFYLNAHLLVGVHLALVAAVPWLMGRGALPTRAVVVPALSVVAIVIGRPEATLLLPLLLVPVAVCLEVPRRAVWVLSATFAAATFLWWVVVLWGLVPWSPTSAATASVAAAVGVLLLTAGAPRLRRHPATASRLSHLVPVALTLVLVLYLVTDGGEVLWTSLGATARNLAGEGLWGLLVPVLVLLLAIVSWAWRLPAGQVFTVPLVGFLPLALVLAYARGGGYRVGPGDSLNRMWVHLLPLAVTYLALVLLEGRPRPRTADGGAGPATGRAERS
jgi:hypothetical protein